MLKDIDPQSEGETNTITSEHRKKQRTNDSVTDQGLRINDSTPIELIHMPAPEMQGEDADQYEIIDRNALKSRSQIQGKMQKGYFWSFYAEQDEGADADNLAVFQTLIVSCRLAGIDPCKYLVDVLQRIGHHPARNIRGDLIPRIWKEKFGAKPLKSDLDRQGGNLPLFRRLP